MMRHPTHTGLLRSAANDPTQVAGRSASGSSIESLSESPELPGGHRFIRALDVVREKLSSGKDCNVVELIGNLAAAWSSLDRQERRRVLPLCAAERCRVIADLTRHAMDSMDRLATQQISELLSHCVALGVRNGDLNRAVSKRVAAEADSMPIDELARVLRGFAELRVNDTRLFNQVAHRLERFGGFIDPQALINLAIAYALPNSRGSAAHEPGEEKIGPTPLDKRDTCLSFALALAASERSSEVPPQQLLEMLEAIKQRPIDVVSYRDAGAQAKGILRNLMSSDSGLVHSLDRGQLLPCLDSCAALGASFRDPSQAFGLRRLIERAGEYVQELSLDEVVQFFRSLSTMRLRQEVTVDRFIGRVIELRSELDESSFASLTRSWRDGQMIPAKALLVLADQAVEIARTASDPHFADIVTTYSHARFGRDRGAAARLVTAYVDGGVRRQWSDLKSFALFASACARAGVFNPSLYHSFSQIVLHNRDLSATQDPRVIARLVWSYVKLAEPFMDRAGRVDDFFDTYFFEELQSYLVSRLADLTSIDLSNLARSVAMVIGSGDSRERISGPEEIREQSVDLLQSIAATLVDRLVRRPPDGINPADWNVSAQSVAVLLWALGRAHLNNPEVLRTVIRVSSSELPSYKMEEMSKILWGLARLRYRDVSFFNAVAGEAVSRLRSPDAGQRCSLQDVCMLAWSFATLNVPSDELCQEIADFAGRNGKSWSLRDRIQLGWCFAILKPDLVGRVITERSLGLIREEDEWRQAYHSLLGGGLVSCKEKFGMLDHLRSRLSENISSRFEQEIFEELVGRLGLPDHLIERNVLVAGVPVDMVIGRLIVECDGDKWHRSEGPDGDALLGRDALQDRLFRAAGYEIIHLRNEQYHSVQRAQVLRNLVEAIRQSSGLFTRAS
jgi:hypothetical protein